MKILVQKRSDHYIAYLADNPCFWGSGKSENEAIGNLLRTWPEIFKITIFQEN